MPVLLTLHAYWPSQTGFWRMYETIHIHYTVYSKVVNFLLIWVEFQCRFMMFVIVEGEFLLYTGSMVQLTEPSIHSHNTQSLNLLCPEMTANYMDWVTRSFGSFSKRKGLLTVFLYFTVWSHFTFSDEMNFGQFQNTSAKTLLGDFSKTTFTI
jgi:hypothetical protein